ncbi:MAG: tetratricopeptide repeat protein [Proteobacteria bacterium]|nr:tetratricopeptide repeat protein [Pseudomonadota bacterium]
MANDQWQAALIAWESGDAEAAGRILEELLALFPDHIPARHLYAVIQTETGSPDEAVRQLRQVCQADPANDQALSNLGNALHATGDLAGAETALRAGLALNPANPLLHFNLGNVMSAARRPQEAEAAFLRASEFDPADQETWMRLGSLRYARGDHEGAASAFLCAAGLAGNDKATALRLAGFALADGGRPEEADPVLSKFLAALPAGVEDLHALSQLLYCRLELCDWREIPDIAARCRKLLEEGISPLEPSCFLFVPEIGAAEQLSLTANFAQQLIPANSLPGHGVAAADPERRLRIGYLCEMFHEHATAYLVTGVLECHDHARFEIHAFSYGPPDSGDMRRRLVVACDRFHDVAGLDIKSLAERIRAENIDILIDLNGWTGNTKSAVLAHRPAPVQVNWLGYPGTLGSRRFADYLIGDPVVTPLVHQPFYAEMLALMPHCYQPNDRRRAVARVPSRREAGLPAQGFVFCSFNRSLKITAQIFGCWCDLLRDVPGSVLWLLAGNRVAMARLVAAAGERGIDGRRLVFAPYLPQAEHLARLSLADLVLDTFPCGAHTTASDALWSGVPLLTLIGETFSSRVAASLLNAVGLPQMVTRTLDEYRDLALAMALNPDTLESTRLQLRENRLSRPLFDTEGFARDFEALLRTMWRQYCSDTMAPIAGISRRPD